MTSSFLPRWLRLATAVGLFSLFATTSSAQTQWLQNDSFDGTAATCNFGIDPEEYLAARFTAPPEMYPYTISKVRVLCCSATIGSCIVDIWRDNGNLSPSTLLYTSFPNEIAIGGSPSATFYDIPVTGAPAITSGTIRVGLYMTVQSTGFGVDANGIIANRNLVMTTNGVWHTSESLSVAGDWILRVEIVGPATDVDDGSTPRELGLHDNVPNPFNPTTTIRYDVPAGGADVNISVFDATGRAVQTLVNGQRAAGRWSVQWNGEDASGIRVASGVYFYRMRAGSFVETKKMVLLK